MNAWGISLLNILRLVAENSDFLAEQQLKELLGPHIDKEKMLIKMDRVFTVSNRQHFQFFFAFPFKSSLQRMLKVLYILSH